MKKLLCLTVLSAIVALPAFGNTMNDDASSTTTTTESVKKSSPSSMSDDMQRMEEKKTTTETKDSMKGTDQSGSNVDTTIKKRTEKSSY